MDVASLDFSAVSFPGNSHQHLASGAKASFFPFRGIERRAGRALSRRKRGVASFGRPKADGVYHHLESGPQMVFLSRLAAQPAVETRAT